MSVYLTSIDSSFVRELQLEQPGRTQEVSTPRPVRDPDAVPFAEVLGEVVESANSSLNHADAATTAFARGEQNDLHGTMLALSQANIKLQLVNEVRNHLLEAYREAMRMSV